MNSLPAASYIYGVSLAAFGAVYGQGSLVHKTSRTIMGLFLGAVTGISFGWLLDFTVKSAWHAARFVAFNAYMNPLSTALAVTAAASAVFLYKSVNTVKAKPVSKPLRTLEPLQESQRNIPIGIASVTKRTKAYSRNAILYNYNSEGIRDYGWGCAWRAIQTCLSSYKITFPFEELFHAYGSREKLEEIYQSKYPGETFPTSKIFAPYELSNGWAEPFIGHLVLHHLNISSALECVNAVPENCNAPVREFRNEPLKFSAFRERLIKHFENQEAAPVMMDDGSFALNIIGIECDGSDTKLWLSDPHINENVNTNPTNQTPVGLYTITLDETGKQISCSLQNEDVACAKKMYISDIFSHYKFDEKAWMVLFPLECKDA